ncbi:hypothetical protein KM043_008296 [Ampulex compressa]|nr:hypothetical protein KM043_008296 [Ampulex compressa]
MDVLPMNFKILSFCGAWHEHEQKNLFKHLARLCHKSVILIVICSFTISEVIELIHARDNVKELTEGLFTTLTYIALCFKFGNFLSRKKEMSSLLDYFRLDVCQSRNFAEYVILEKYNSKAKFCALSFLTFSEFAGLTLVVAPLVENRLEDRALPFKFYTPYPTSDLLLYWITYVEQIAGVIYGKKLFSAAFLSLTLYLGSMLFQIFMYCWYGNELELKSKNIGNAIYASNWVSADVQERKSLCIIMIISQKGLALSYYGMFAMALNTFMWILKTSYSAFSLLQQVSV